jgi:molybdopterin biosynthesis enzyme
VVHHFKMIPTQRLPLSLTPLDSALAALLQGIEPVLPVALPRAEALGSVAADMPPLRAHPSRDVAVSDGWALRAVDLVGASSYSPLPLSASPVWVEAGEAMPAGCDCVIDADLLDQTGPMVQALGEATPGQGVRRAGSEIVEASTVIAPGRRIRPLDLLIARAGGLAELNVRRPRLRIVNIPATSGAALTARLIAESAQAASAAVISVDAPGRNAASIAEAVATDACDMLVTSGGSGVGGNDAVVAALATRGEVIVHGIALQPGRTAAVGRIGTIPVVALPGAPDQALAAWWTLALPALDILSGRSPRRPVTLPLARKIASSVGIAELVLLQRIEDRWLPLAVGDFSLDAIARADAWLEVPGAAEGRAAGMPVDAYMLRD